MSLFLQGIEFVISLIGAEVLFIHTFERRRFFWLKAVGEFILLSALFIIVPNLEWMSGHPFQSILSFLMMFFASALCFGTLYRASVWNVLFCCVAGYAVQHMGFNSAVILQSILVGEFVSVFTGIYWGIRFLSYGLVGSFSYHFFAKKIRNGNCGNIDNWIVVLLSGIILSVTVVLNQLLSFGDKDIFTSNLISAYACLNCALLLVIQFEVRASGEMQLELETLQQLMKKERKQYELSKENVEFLNILCHDLKYQMYRRGDGQEASPLQMDQVHSALALYDMIAKTGNKTLDVILTENTLWCNKHGITLTCMAEGEGLSFVDEMDIYSLFGNALNNAIESVFQIKTPQKRFVSLTVRTVNQFLSIQVENYFEGDIRLREEDGLPYSTKSDERWHGYGMKSMQQVVKKYDGNLSVNLHNDIFTLNIYLSIPA